MVTEEALSPQRDVDNESSGNEPTRVEPTTSVTTSLAAAETSAESGDTELVAPEVSETSNELTEDASLSDAETAASEDGTHTAHDSPEQDSPEHDADDSEEDSDEADSDESEVEGAETGADGASGETPTKRKRKKKKKKKEERGEFVDYFDFSESLTKLPPHRILAINRGEKAKAIRVRIEFNEEGALAEGVKRLVPEGHALRELLETWLKDALHRLIVPSLEREVRRELTERAETHAVSVFATNLRNLLLQPPVSGRKVMALDPGYKRGCQVAVIDETGTPLESQVIFVVGNGERRRRGRAWLAEAARKHGVKIMAIGNGTASREAEKLVAEMLDAELNDLGIAYVMVNEAGASVYSTSAVGREELPSLDPTLRSAVSIGRRLLDPLSELVKISAEHLGVGMYQHDVKAKHLRDSLDVVVESCVNFVGVEANTASPALLRYVSGLNQLSAKRFVEYRNEHGPFRSRREFSQVPGFGEATFVQAAGFLKIPRGEHPFDATWIHPESYGVAERVLEKLGYSLDDVRRVLGGRSHSASLAATTPSGPNETSSAEPNRIEPTELEPTAAVSAELTPDATAIPPTDEVAESEPSSPLAVEPTVSTGAGEAEESLDAVAAPEAANALDTAESAVVSIPESVAPEPAVTPEEIIEFQRRVAAADVERLATELETGELLVRDILASLLRPGRDPREALPPPVMRTGATRIEDRKPGMAFDGRILNVVDFGVFVDFGFAVSGLVHISHLSRNFVKDPHQDFAVGQSIRVWVMEVDKSRRRVSLTAIDPAEPAVERTRGPRRRGKRGAEEGERGAGAARGQGRRPAGDQAGSARGEGEQRSNQRGFGRGGNRRGGRPETGPRRGRPTTQGPRKAAPPRKPPEPLKKEVAEGKAPMRSFTELMQFYHQRRDES
ncbi:MAG: helix-hairpin-helix domain-containing protein [Pirellulaceae bacterium]